MILSIFTIFTLIVLCYAIYLWFVAPLSVFDVAQSRSRKKWIVGSAAVSFLAIAAAMLNVPGAIAVFFFAAAVFVLQGGIVAAQNTSEIFFR